MKHLRRIQKTFVRQLGSNDCGIACVSMVLKYAGLEEEAAMIRATFTDRDLSLLDLRNLAGQHNLQAKCVEMDLQFLRTTQKPCILHLDDEHAGHHFQVCYGRENKDKEVRYLMADPSRGIYYLTEALLSEIWVSRAALYFEQLISEPAKQHDPSWHLLLSGRLIPTGLLVSIPLLSIFSAILGVAWSWALQRGIYSSIEEKETRLIAGMIILLFLITMAKNIFTYIRQQLMIRINCVVNRHLTLSFMRHILWPSDSVGNRRDPAYYKNGMSGMMKIQQAVSAFLATILSDGSIIVLVLAALFYQSLIFGLIILIYLFTTAIYSYRTFPILLFETAHLNELSGSSEKFILNDMSLNHINQPENVREIVYNFHAGNHTQYLKYASKLSNNISRNSLILDCLGTCCVISVFIYGILEMRSMNLSYSAFMIAVIFSYFVTASMPKICSALFLVTEGIASSRQYRVVPVS